MQPKGVFISAVNTNYGKTWLTRALLIHHQQSQTSSNLWRAIKPIQSGFSQKANPNSDAFLLFEAEQTQTESKISIDDICLYSFKEAVAPNKAAELEATNYQFNDLVQFCQIQLSKGFCLVEGAGGLFSPIANDGLNLDLAQSLNLPCLLVTHDILGSISTTIASVVAAQKYGVQIFAVVINYFEPQSDRQTKAELEKWLTDIPILTITKNPSIDEIGEIYRQVNYLLNL